MSIARLALREVATAKRQRSGTKPPAAGAAAAPPPDARASALESLSEYIPVDIGTLYVASLSAYEQLRATWARVTPAGIYWTFVVLTPLLLLLIVVGDAKRQGATVDFGKRLYFKMAAATIAFMVWGLAIPDNPYIVGAAAAVAGLFAMVVSTILTKLEPLFT